MRYIKSNAPRRRLLSPPFARKTGLTLLVPLNPDMSVLFKDVPVLVLFGKLSA